MTSRNKLPEAPVELLSDATPKMSNKRYADDKQQQQQPVPPLTQSSSDSEDSDDDAGGISKPQSSSHNNHNKSGLQLPSNLLSNVTPQIPTTAESASVQSAESSISATSSLRSSQSCPARTAPKRQVSWANPEALNWSFHEDNPSVSPGRRDRALLHLPRSTTVNDDDEEESSTTDDDEEDYTSPHSDDSYDSREESYSSYGDYYDDDDSDERRRRRRVGRDPPGLYYETHNVPSWHGHHSSPADQGSDEGSDATPDPSRAPPRMDSSPQLPSRRKSTDSSKASSKRSYEDDSSSEEAEEEEDEDNDDETKKEENDERPKNDPEEKDSSKTATTITNQNDENSQNNATPTISNMVANNNNNSNNTASNNKNNILASNSAPTHTTTTTTTVTRPLHQKVSTITATTTKHGLKWKTAPKRPNSSSAASVSSHSSSTSSYVPGKNKKTPKNIVPIQRIFQPPPPPSIVPVATRRLMQPTRGRTTTTTNNDNSSAPPPRERKRSKSPIRRILEKMSRSKSPRLRLFRSQASPQPPQTPAPTATTTTPTMTTTNNSESPNTRPPTAANPKPVAMPDSSMADSELRRTRSLRSLVRGSSKQSLGDASASSSKTGSINNSSNNSRTNSRSNSSSNNSRNHSIKRKPPSPSSSKDGAPVPTSHHNDPQAPTPAPAPKSLDYAHNVVDLLTASLHDTALMNNKSKGAPGHNKESTANHRPAGNVHTAAALDEEDSFQNGDGDDDLTIQHRQEEKDDNSSNSGSIIQSDDDDEYLEVYEEDPDYDDEEEDHRPPPISSATLTVTVLSVRDLFAKERRLLGKLKLPNPYMEFYVGEQCVGQTAVRRRTRHPTFDQTLVCELGGFLASQLLLDCEPAELRIFDDHGGRKFLGALAINVLTMVLDKPEWFAVQEQSVVEPHLMCEGATGSVYCKVDWVTRYYPELHPDHVLLLQTPSVALDASWTASSTDTEAMSAAVETSCVALDDRDGLILWDHTVYCAHRTNTDRSIVYPERITTPPNEAGSPTTTIMDTMVIHLGQIPSIVGVLYLVIYLPLENDTLGRATKWMEIKCRDAQTGVGIGRFLPLLQRKDTTAVVMRLSRGYKGEWDLAPMEHSYEGFRDFGSMLPHLQGLTRDCLTAPTIRSAERTALMRPGDRIRLSDYYVGTGVPDSVSLSVYWKCSNRRGLNVAMILSDETLNMYDAVFDKNPESATTPGFRRRYGDDNHEVFEIDLPRVETKIHYVSFVIGPLDGQQIDHIMTVACSMTVENEHGTVELARTTLSGFGNYPTKSISLCCFVQRGADEWDFAVLGVSSSKASDLVDCFKALEQTLQKNAPQPAIGLPKALLRNVEWKIDG